MYVRVTRVVSGSTHCVEAIAVVARVLTKIQVVDGLPRHVPLEPHKLAGHLFVGQDRQKIKQKGERRNVGIR